MLLIHFPVMHPELADASVGQAEFFDPGLTDAPLPGAFRPQGLPMTPKAARRLYDDCIQFGEQFKNSKEMATFGVIQDQRPDAPRTPSAIQAELESRLRGEGPKPETGDPEADRAAHAQFLLILAYALEERVLEIRGLDDGLSGAWDKFDASLGLDGDSDEAAVLGQPAAGADGGPGGVLPWQTLLEAVALYLPADGVLVVNDPDMAASFEEFGLVLSEAAAELDLPEGALMGTAPVGRLAGRRKLPEDRPDLMRELAVAVVAG